MKTITKTAALALVAGSMMAAAPASATIFEYTMNDGDILTIDTDLGTGSWIGDDMDVSFEGDSLKSFTGGATPSFMGTLSNMTGTRTIRGVDYTPTRINGTRFHPWMLKTTSHPGFNLWSWWGDPVIAGDYVRKIADYRVVDVPAPGALGLLGLALMALGFGRRRRRAAAA